MAFLLQNRQNFENQVCNIFFRNYYNLIRAYSSENWTNMIQKGRGRFISFIHSSLILKKVLYIWQFHSDRSFVLRTLTFIVWLRIMRNMWCKNWPTLACCKRSSSFDLQRKCKRMFNTVLTRRVTEMQTSHKVSFSGWASARHPGWTSNQTKCQEVKMEKSTNENTNTGI